jgi:hypothetical protein
LVAAYRTGERGWGRRAAAEEMVTMVPVLRAFMPGSTLLMVRKVAGEVGVHRGVPALLADLLEAMDRALGKLYRK